MKLTPLRVGVVFAALYFAVWLLSGYEYFIGQKFDALSLLGIASMPSSYVVEELLQRLASHNVLPEQPIAAVEYLALLVLGCAQYYLVGAVVCLVLRPRLSWMADPFGRRHD